MTAAVAWWQKQKMDSFTDDFAALATPDAVALDFTNAAAALDQLRTAVSQQSPIVIGSTGFTPAAITSSMSFCTPPRSFCCSSFCVR